jgi:hypothetical protein
MLADIRRKTNRRLFLVVTYFLILIVLSGIVVTATHNHLDEVDPYLVSIFNVGKSEAHIRTPYLECPLCKLIFMLGFIVAAAGFILTVRFSKILIATSYQHDVYLYFTSLFNPRAPPVSSVFQA